ncbi:MAG: hypothetical protein LBF34_05320 [Puniceicoccales bacterium]|nr:hypothetical protein [Puniceicoccales bacterium]
MLQNRLTKLRILAIGLLLGIGCNVAMATDFLDEDEEALYLQQEAEQVANAFGVLKNGTEEQGRQAKEFLHSKGVIPEACYTQADIDRAWNGEWASFAQKCCLR